jgi:prepilin-type N-terminal cleavage/methylation domain-containing protein
MVVMRRLRRFTLQNEIPARQGASGGLQATRGLCRRTAGFSLVELCIALVLLGIVLAIAVPSYRGWAANTNLKGAARMVSSDVFDTRARALSESRTYTITYNPDPASTYTIQAAAANGLPAVSVTKTFDEFGGVRLASVNLGMAAYTITIQSRGTVSSPAGTATIGVTNVRNSTGTITVLNTGRAHVTYSMQ